MTTQGRKLYFIDFFKQCCLNATRGRDRLAVHSSVVRHAKLALTQF